MPSKQKSKPRRQALLVLGMHRSGTSALSGVLARLGAAGPKTMMPPTGDNPRGYWESSEIMRLNDEILASAGSRWDDWEAFNPAWRASPEGERLAGKIPAVVQAEFDDARLFVLKDPRICRILPVWVAALEGAGIQVKAVIPVRHPVEVARSLGARDGIPALQALLIWVRHVLDAERASRGLDRAFVSYQRLLQDWRGEIDALGTVLGIEWPRWSGTAQAEVDAYLSSELKHHDAADEKIPAATHIHAWAGRVHRALLDLVGGADEASAIAALDAVAAECEPVLELHAPFVHELRLSMEARIAQEKEQAQACRSELEALARKFDLSRQEVVANYQLAMDYKAKLDDVRNQFQNRENLNATLQMRCDAAEADAERRVASIASELAAGRASHAAEIAGITAERERHEQRHADAMAAALQSHENQLASLKTQHDAEIAALGEELHARIAELRDGKRMAEETAQERSSEIYQLSKRVIDLEHDAQAQAEAFKEQRHQSGALAARLGKAEAEVAALKLRVDALLEVEQGLRAELDACAALLAERHAADLALDASIAWRAVRKLPGIAAGLLPPPAEHGLAEEQCLASSNLFDADWYLRRYPDVKARGMDPARHYLKYGAREGRDPGPAFNTRAYSAQYPDVAAAGLNPLVHYIQHGRREGRRLTAMEHKAKDPDTHERKD